MKTILIVARNFLSMPILMQVASVGMLMFLPLLLLGVPGIGVFLVGGQAAEYRDIMRRGGAWFFLGGGLVSVVLLIGFLSRQGWSRLAAVAPGWAIAIWGAMTWGAFPLEATVAVLVCGIFPTWYFFFNRSVTRYFQANP